MHPVVAATTPEQHSNPAEAKTLDGKPASPHDNKYIDPSAGI